jgi:uncharacterized protein
MTPTPDSSPRIGPVLLAERIEALDVLRGMALFGIIASNMRAFNGPMAAYFDHSLMWQELPNRIAQMFIDLFISGKFITLFSFLFGIGFAVQMDRAAARGLASRAFYQRRLGVLLLMGIAHMYLLWWGDILTVYALMGFLLFLFRGRSQKTILWWSAALYSWPWIMAAGFLVAAASGASVPQPPVPTSQELQRLLQVYSTGTYVEIFRERVKDNLTGMAFIFFYAPRLLGIFLFGLWVFRQGLIRNLSAHRALLEKCQWWGLGAGLVLNAVAVAITEIWHPNPVQPTALGFLLHLVQGVGIPALSVGYAATVALLFQREEWAPRLRPFGAVGRMALTNYLLQTVLCTMLYYGYGFGFYGKVGPLVGLAPTVLIYSAQVAASVRWFQHFAFGPMEWVWRRLTYGRLYPVAVNGAARQAQA